MAFTLPEARLARIGGEFERASLARDWKAATAIEAQIDKFQEEYPELWLAPWIVRGRNAIRRARGLDELHV